MGLIGGIIELLFGSGRNVVKETAEVFRENAEAGAERASDLQHATLAQFGQEFGRQSGGFDRVMDGINRIPRPALALGTLALFLSAMADPVWFAARMQGLALVPEPLWWLLGVVVSFYFGARHQIKAQNFQREIARTMAQAPAVMQNLATLQDMETDQTPEVAGQGATLTVSDNPALDAWKAQRKT